MVRSRVLLPPPLGPTTTTTSPLAIFSETPFSTSVGPNDLCRSSASRSHVPPPFAGGSLGIARQHHFFYPGGGRPLALARSDRAGHAAREVRLEPLLDEAPDRRHREIVERGDN